MSMDFVFYLFYFLKGDGERHKIKFITSAE